MISESQLDLWKQSDIKLLSKSGSAAEMSAVELNATEMNAAKVNEAKIIAAKVSAASSCKNEVVFKDEWIRRYAASRDLITCHVITFSQLHYYLNGTFWSFQPYTLFQCGQ